MYAQARKNLQEISSPVRYKRQSLMIRDDAVFLRHIFNAIEQVEHYTRGMSESEFLSRPMVQDAVIRQIEIVGEAANCISAEYQGEHPKLSWSKVTGIRKRIISENFSARLDSVWNIVQDDLPLFKQAIKKLL